MLKIGRLTDYGTVILARLAHVPGQQLTAAELAAQTHLPRTTVSKLLKQLHGSGLVTSTRGLHGGYRLARAPGLITAAQILLALEGPVALTECSHQANHCGIEASCGVGHAWQRINLAIQRTLQEVTLLDLASVAAAPVQFAALERSATAALRGTVPTRVTP
jgi:FeS assembly SUF system regulator